METLEESFRRDLSVYPADQALYFFRFRNSNETVGVVSTSETLSRTYIQNVYDDFDGSEEIVNVSSINRDTYELTPVEKWKV